MSSLPFSPLAVLLASLSTFLVGGLWYSPVLFGKAWQRETGLGDETLRARSQARIFGTSFVLALLMAANLAAFIGPEATPGFAIAASAAAGLGWVALGMGVTYLFENRSLKLWLIDAGYHSVSFTLMGVVIGLVR